MNWRIIARDEATLVWLANRAAIELHAWLARISALAQPDLLVFDLDPGPAVDFPTICQAALDVRTVLGRADLTAWPKTSGGKGLHLTVPVAPGSSFATTRAWAERVSTAFARRWSARFTSLSRTTERADRILIDYAQNSFGRTTVSVYSARAVGRHCIHAAHVGRGRVQQLRAA